MKPIAISLLLFFTAATTNLSGTWSGAFKADGSDHEVPQVLLLKQTGNTLRGTGGPNQSEQYPIAHGKIADNKASFEITTGEWTFTYDLKFSDTEMHGILILKSMHETREATVSLKKIA